MLLSCWLHGFSCTIASLFGIQISGRACLAHCMCHGDLPCGPHCIILRPVLFNSLWNRRNSMDFGARNHGRARVLKQICIVQIGRVQHSIVVWDFLYYVGSWLESFSSFLVLSPQELGRHKSARRADGPARLHWARDETKLQDEDEDEASADSFSTERRKWQSVLHYSSSQNQEMAMFPLCRKSKRAR
jgi:hypothetical protein